MRTCHGVDRGLPANSSNASNRPYPLDAPIASRVEMEWNGDLPLESMENGMEIYHHVTELYFPVMHTSSYLIVFPVIYRERCALEIYL